VVRTAQPSADTILPKSVHSDGWLSEQRFNFHSVRVSGEKPALVQKAPAALQTQRAYLVGAPLAQFAGRVNEVRNMIPLSAAEKVLRQNVEEMARLIAELHVLQMRVRRAEATACDGRHVAVRKLGGLLTI